MSNHFRTNVIQLICIYFVTFCTSKTINTNESIIKSSNSTKCDELPLVVLQRVLGPAFDARYMSVNRPMDDEMAEDYTDVDDPELYKRKSEGRPSFYLTENKPRPLGQVPAWNMQWETYDDTQKINSNTDSKIEAATAAGAAITTTTTKISNQRRRKRNIHNRQIPKMTIDKNLDESIDKMEKERDNNRPPWKCDHIVKWVDLGPDYHPSHVRTIECTRQSCYYGQFECRPKQFGIHILRRRRGICANAHNLKSFGYLGDFAEVWEWVEVAINFCCDCVVSRPSYYY